MAGLPAPAILETPALAMAVKRLSAASLDLKITPRWSEAAKLFRSDFDLSQPGSGPPAPWRREGAYWINL